MDYDERDPEEAYYAPAYPSQRIGAFMILIALLMLAGCVLVGYVASRLI